MEIKHHLSRPVGVGRLMYVGDTDIPGYNRGAMLICEVGIGAVAAGLLTGNKPLTKGGVVAAIVGFLAL
jgi:hypothetical protein